MFKLIIRIERIPKKITNFNTELNKRNSFFELAFHILIIKKINGATIESKQYTTAKYNFEAIKFSLIYHNSITIAISPNTNTTFEVRFKPSAIGKVLIP